jgi:hypothetical protein
MSVRSGTVAIWVVLALLAAGQQARASCSGGVSTCTVSDFKTASGSSGCGLLFIATRNQTCTTAGASLHTATSCGPIGTSPPACAKGADNKARLTRWEQCLSDRVAQQSAFASGLSDVEAARKVKWSTGKQAIVGYLNTIEAAIKQGQPGHATEIKGVKVSVANCKKFPGNQ